MTRGAPAGIDPDRVGTWFTREVPKVEPPLEYELIAGGRSNLTYRVTDRGGRAWVLRRPPLHGVLESAHDVAREYRIIRALAGTDVPVPPAVATCDEPAVTGAPFFVMGHVDGHVVRSTEDADRWLDEEGRRRAAEDLADVLAALHAVDPASVGLGDLGPKEGYIDRQLRRWHRQLEQGRVRELPLMDELYERLARSIPPQRGVGIVHGDYRLDNLIVSAAGAVRAVLDWELCTLGDPLADVGLLMVYWTEPGDETAPLPFAATAAEGFPGRAEVAARYASASGRDLSELDYYVAFGLWKVAAILEGVHARFAAGAYGDEHDDSYRAFADVVLRLAEQSAEAAARSGR